MEATRQSSFHRSIAFRSFVVLLSTLTLVALGPAQARAWPAAGVVLDPGSNNQQQFQLTVDPATGDVVAAWNSYYNGGTNGYFARVTPDGTLDPNWSVHNDLPYTQYTLDGAGGLWFSPRADFGFNADFVPFEHYFVSHLDVVGGNTALGPPPGGTAVVAQRDTFGDSPYLAGDMCTDGARGILLTLAGFGPYTVRFTHLLAGGYLPPGEDSSGTILFTTSQPAKITSGVRMHEDGNGGAFVILGNGSTTHALHAYHVQADGTLAPGWPAGGLDLDPAGTDSGPLLDFFRSGPDGWIAAWSGNGHVGMRRFLDAGTLDPAWPTLAAGPGGAGAMSDGAGGVYVTWQAGNSALVARVRADRSIDPAWPATGHTLLDPAAVPTGPIVFTTTSIGGVAVAWGDARVTGQKIVRLKLFSSDSFPTPGVPAAGILVSLAADTLSIARAIVSDGVGGCYIAFSDETNHLAPYGIMTRLQHIAQPATVGTPGGLAVRVTALAPPRPNPARDGFACAVDVVSAAGARVELLDLRGRIVEARRLSSAGRQDVRFDGLAGLPRGVYFVRVLDGGTARSTRVALVR